MSATIIPLGPYMQQRDSTKHAPDVERELRRYRNLRAIGWGNGLCGACYRLIWLRAGEEQPIPTSELQKIDGDGVI